MSTTARSRRRRRIVGIRRLSRTRRSDLSRRATAACCTRARSSPSERLASRITGGPLPMTTYRKTAEALARLTPEQYRVTQKGHTEAPGTGELLDNHEPGIYVDIVSGEP